jgi:hypothetical protein
MAAALITRTDLFESARQQLGADDLSGVRAQWSDKPAPGQGRLLEAFAGSVLSWTKA